MLSHSVGRNRVVMSKSEAGGQIKETKGRAGKMMEQDKEKRK